MPNRTISDGSDSEPALLASGLAECLTVVKSIKTTVEQQTQTQAQLRIAVDAIRNDIRGLKSSVANQSYKDQRYV